MRANFTRRSSDGILSRVILARSVCLTVFHNTYARSSLSAPPGIIIRTHLRRVEIAENARRLLENTSSGAMILRARDRTLTRLRFSKYRSESSLFSTVIGSFGETRPKGLRCHTIVRIGQVKYISNTIGANLASSSLARYKVAQQLQQNFSIEFFLILSHDQRPKTE